MSLQMVTCIKLTRCIPIRNLQGTSFGIGVNGDNQASQGHQMTAARRFIETSEFDCQFSAGLSSTVGSDGSACSSFSDMIISRAFKRSKMVSHSLNYETACPRAGDHMKDM